MDRNDCTLTVTLIHGTFAQKAAWIRDDSPICMALKKAFSGVQLLPFEWSGRNSAKRRLKGAKTLSEPWYRQ